MFAVLSVTTSLQILKFGSNINISMRILMLLSQTEITGAEVHAVQLSERLKNLGHEVFIISDTLTAKTNIPHIRRSLHPKSFLLRLRNILFVHRFIKDNKIDVIHAHSRAAIRVAFWAHKATNTALVSTIHGRQHFSLSKRIFNLYGRHIITICENIKTHLIKDFGISKNYITTIGNPVDDLQMTFVSKLSSEKKIAVVGRTSGPKGEQTKFLILNVFPEILKRHPDLKIELVGGPLVNLGIEAQKKMAELNQNYPDSIRQFHSTTLEKEMDRYQMVFAAGRIAIAALFRGIPLWAMGEDSSLGFVESRNFKDACISNFGDIGAKAKKSSLLADKILEQLDLFLKNGLPSETARKEVRELALKEFQFPNVTEKIIILYKAAVLKQRHPRFIPILMYHLITDEPVNTRHRIFVTKENFEKQLQRFKAWGFTSLNFQDLEDFMDGKKNWSDFPKKPLMLTFDDGYQNNLTHALPLLKKYDYKAVIYLLANHNVLSNEWDVGEVPSQPLLNPQERQELAQSGFFEIASHGLEHRHLPEMSLQEVQKQLDGSKKFLENEFKKPILSYAFTYGSRRDDLADLAFRSGYKFILNTDQGGFHLSVPITSIFRVPIFPEDSGMKLWRKLQPWYRFYFFLTRKK
jgi:peptidoglycan/xylan/chitin deacetylase (PgdA/CDA1 family)